MDLDTVYLENIYFMYGGQLNYQKLINEFIIINSSQNAYFN